MKFERLKLIFYTVGLMSMLVGVISCSSSTDPYKPYVGDKEIVYPQKIDTVIAYPGIDRVFFRIPKPSDKRVKKVGVFWNNESDSLKVNFSEGKDIVQVEIDSLSAGLSGKNHTFDVYSYDKAGNKSVAMYKRVDIFGKEYINTISNRSIKSRSLTLSLDLILKWGDVPDNALGTVVKYTNTSGKTDSLFVPRDSTQTVVSNYKINSTINYNTLYPLTLDTISTSYEKLGGELHQIYLANSGPNFQHTEWDGEAWGNLQDWKANKAAKTHDGYGGWGYAYNQTSGPGFIAFSNYRMDAPLYNAKVYKNVELPAGSYSFEAYNYRLFGLSEENKVYLAVAKGSVLPDEENISNSIDHALLEGDVNKVEFTLNQKTSVTLGFVAVIKGDRQFARISKVRLKIK